MMRSNVTAAALVALLLVSGLAFSQTAPAPAPASFITGVGNFSHIVANLDKSLEFYRDVIGLPVNGAIRPFDPNPTIMRLGNTIGAQSRMVQLRVPGSAMGVEIIEYKDIEKGLVRRRFQDPGNANLMVRVRDLDSVLPRIKKSGVKILSKGGVPATVGTTRAMFLEDPDGFIIELSQPGTLPAATPDNPGNVISGGFEAVAGDSDKTVAFYQKVLGFQLTSNAFNNDKLMTDTAGTPGAAFRQSRGPIPGTTYTMVFIEFKDIDRLPLRTNVQDPGTVILQLNVRDMDGLMKVLKANNVEIVSTGGEPVSLGAGKIVIARDPNNMLLEFIQR